MTATAVPTAMPAGFWRQIDHQLDRIATERPNTFAEVRAILHDPACTEVARYVGTDGARRFDERSGFFAGSGGDRTLLDSLVEASWEVVEMTASYHYRLRHPDSGSALTYTEGDIDDLDRPLRR